MKKIFKILNLNEQLQVLILAFLILITSFSEILLLLFIQPILQFFLNNNLSYRVNFFLFDYSFTSKLLFLSFMVIFFLRNIFYTLTILFKTYFIKNLNIHISNKIYSSYLKKDYSFFLKNNSAKLISNITNEVDHFCQSVFNNFLTFLTEIFLLLAIIFFLVIKFFFIFLLVSIPTSRYESSDSIFIINCEFSLTIKYFAFYFININRQHQ